MEPTREGKFIVLDGIDGCGKGTQTKLLSDFLIQKGYKVVNKHYPEYGQPIGDIINEWLHKKYDFNVESQVLLYFADFIKDKQLIGETVKNSGIMLADRYFTTTIVYQHLKGFPLENLIKLADLFELPKPDLSILIRISAETSLARKSKQKPDRLDRHEEDKKFQSSLAETFEKIAAQKALCDWEIVDGEQPIENVHQQIVEILHKKFKI
ncbi:MAG: dTMP kinase [Candidatus Paceibacterota bacterium]